MKAPRILALDTTAESGSLAIADGAAAIEEVLLHAPDGFGHVLFDRVLELLARHAWTLESIDCFAAASGPGSFTGVRVGLAAAKGLAEALSKPMVAISNLRLIASFGSAPLRAAFINARRGEVYGGVYDACGLLSGEETVQPFEQWRAQVPASAEYLSTAPGLFPNISVTAVPQALAAAAARIACAEFEAGRALDPVAADANYIRRSDAELFWKE